MDKDIHDLGGVGGANGCFDLGDSLGLWSWRLHHLSISWWKFNTRWVWALSEIFNQVSQPLRPWAILSSPSPKSKVPKPRPIGLRLTRNHMHHPNHNFWSILTFGRRVAVGTKNGALDAFSQKFWFVSLTHPSVPNQGQYSSPWAWHYWMPGLVLIELLSGTPIPPNPRSPHLAVSYIWH